MSVRKRAFWSAFAMLGMAALATCGIVLAQVPEANEQAVVEQPASPSTPAPAAAANEATTEGPRPGVSQAAADNQTPPASTSAPAAAASEAATEGPPPGVSSAAAVGQASSASQPPPAAAGARAFGPADNAARGLSVSVTPATPRADASASTPLPGQKPGAVSTRGAYWSSGTQYNVGAYDPYPATQGYNSAAGYGAPYQGEFARPVDPEMQKLLQEDAAMEAEAKTLAAQFHNAGNEADRTALRKSLEDLTARHFLVRQKRRELEISQLEDQLKHVRESWQKRNDAKDLIIRRRVSRLIGEEDELAF
jgi:hypothetical protein